MAFEIRFISTSSSRAVSVVVVGGSSAMRNVTPRASAISFS